MRTITTKIFNTFVTRSRMLLPKACLSLLHKPTDYTYITISIEQTIKSFMSINISTISHVLYTRSRAVTVKNTDYSNGALIINSASCV